MKAAVLCVLVLLVYSASTSAANAPQPKKLTLYKVALTGNVTMTANGTQPVDTINAAKNSSTMTASWTFHPKETELWLATYDSVLTDYKTKASAADNEQNTGHIQATETFTWFDPNQRPIIEPMKGTSDCSGPVSNHIVVQYSASATRGGTTLDVDLTGLFRTDNGAGLNEVPCTNDPDKRNVSGQPSPPSGFDFGWDPTQPEDNDNQRMELGDIIPPQQIGERSISPPLQDFSAVHWARSCSNLRLLTCDVTFKLSGDLTLTKVCDGTIGGGGKPACGSGGGTQPPQPNPPPPGGGNGSGKAPKLTSLTVMPHSFASSSTAARLTYHESQPGSQTTIKVTGKIAVGHGLPPVTLPLGAFVHTDATAAVAFPLSDVLAGHAFPKGTYTLTATPFNPKTQRKGSTVTTTFVVT